MIAIRLVVLVMLVCVSWWCGVGAVTVSDPWFSHHGCAASFQQAKDKLAAQYDTCRKGVTGCSTTCITQYAQAFSQLDCATPDDLTPVVQACNASCPGSWLCDAKKLQCAYPLAGHSCDNYKTCVNDVVDCGSDGYALGFGYKYCSAYLDEDQSFSSYGQQWALQVRKCLQRQFVNQSIATMTCQQISDFAIGTHFGCYQGPPSYCGLSFTDKWIVSTTAASALFSSRFWPILQQAFQVNVACFLPWASTLDVETGTGTGTDAAQSTMPHLLTLRVTWNIPRDTLVATFASAAESALHDTIMSFLQRVESAVTSRFPSLPSNGTILFGTMGGTSNTTTLDLMISTDPAAPPKVDIYAVATYVQQHLSNGDIGSSPYPIANVQSLAPIPTTPPTGNPNTNTNSASANNATPIALMLALCAAVYAGLQ